MPTEHGLCFTGDMVRAILDGRKTQTRRPIKPQPEWPDFDKCPMWIGDVIWVRETWTYVTIADNERTPIDRWHPHNCWVRMFYRADADAEGWQLPAKWTPSILMPRWASRITCDVTCVGAQRLTSIDEAGARAEGFESRAAFLDAWDRMYAKRGLGRDVNPWLWVYTFARIEKELGNGNHLSL